MAVAPIRKVQGMRSSRLLTIAAVAVSLAGAASTAAQSLADVAKREEERRKDIKSPSKVLTNQDLTPAPNGGTAAAAAGAAGAKTADSPDAAKDKDGKDAKDKSAKAQDQGSDAKDKDGKDKDAKDKEPNKDQKY